MSVLSRVVLAGLACASLGAAPAGAWAQAASGDANTGGRFIHAGKCVVTLGFSGDCDKDAATPRRADRAAAAPAVEDTGTRHQLMHASKCVISFGFVGSCNKDAPSGSRAVDNRPAPSPRAEAGPAPAPAPAVADNSTRRQFVHAGKCVVTLGFGGGCDSK